jgi:hypothetical protein
MALTTTSGYAIVEIDYGVALMQGERIITSYRITKCNNGKWRVRLSGASFGLEIGYYVSESKTYGAVFNQCVADLNSIIDEFVTGKANA